VPAYLVDRDDFNRSPPPYKYARRSADASCYAESYKPGSQYLLIFKRHPGSSTLGATTKTESGDLTLSWFPLGPVNEQLHSDTDPWLLWVRNLTSALLPAPPDYRLALP